MAKKVQQKRCFVVMGFGEKTDYATGRKLDLNQSYQVLIKPVVEEKGLVCIRADEVKQSGVIDVFMYQELFGADIVIADLSTANLNAFYELGIRHALRPYTTIVISEDKLAYPFNLNHIKITSYTHLGTDIGYTEVQRFRKVLGEQIDAVLKAKNNDSPVYTFLNDLIPPSLKPQTKKSINQISDALLKGKGEQEKASGKEKSLHQKGENHIVKEELTLSFLAEKGEEALKLNDYTKAVQFFKKALDASSSGNGIAQRSNDPYLIHRLAFTTYKSEKPNTLSALKKALKHLSCLDLEHTNNPETVSLAGAVEKKLYEQGEGLQHLTKAINYYERGYYLLTNRYNAINLAYTLNCRVDTELDPTKEEKIADLIVANRTRKKVLELCDNDLMALQKKNIKQKGKVVDEYLLQRQRDVGFTQEFWIWANRAEAYFGLRNKEAYQKARKKAMEVPHEDWMLKSLDEQVKKLDAVLKNHAYLIPI